MKTYKKIVLLLEILLMIVLIFEQSVFAMEDGGGGSYTPGSSSSTTSSTSSSSSGVGSASDIIGTAQGFVERGQQGSQISVGEATANLLPIANILMSVALGVLVIVGLIMGVKYMISGADEKAKMKERLIWYVISAVVIFGAVGIYNAVVGILGSLGI